MARSTAGVRKVLYGHSAESTLGFLRCTGVELDGGSHVFANLFILAAGAWTPSVVDLEGRATATCQLLSYLPLNEEEQKSLDSLPIYFNNSKPVVMDLVTKIQRKYQSISQPFGEDTQSIVKVVSVPRTDLPIPFEAEKA
ncbi:fructosyl amino acid oxidase [Penicillium majusculum]|nr:fructosyl amino acid oxidase [Penicillium majusculum]